MCERERVRERERVCVCERERERERERVYTDGSVGQWQLTKKYFSKKQNTKEKGFHVRGTCYYDHVL